MEIREEIWVGFRYWFDAPKLFQRVLLLIHRHRKILTNPEYGSEHVWISRKFQVTSSLESKLMKLLSYHLKLSEALANSSFACNLWAHFKPYSLKTLTKRQINPSSTAEQTCLKSIRTIKLPVIFKARGIEPDVRLSALGTEFHVHSVVLRMQSAFFFKFLDSPEKKEAPVLKTDFAYEWVSKIDDDGSWSLVAASSSQVKLFQPW